jgi:heat shock protein HslJ
MVSLTVSDQHGQSGTASQQIHILARPVPTAPPTLPPPTALPPTQPAPTLPPPPTQIPPTEVPPTPVPPTPTPEPQLDPPQANVNGPRQGFIGEPVVFDASASQPGSSPIVTYNWTFGNGTVSPVSPDPSISTIYDRAGDYEVTVFVVDANGMDSYASTRITIDARLETAVWTLPSLNGQPLVPGTAITLQFLQGRLTGFASCNTYDGSYTATDNGDGTYSIVGQQISTSRLACPPEIMNQENAYMAALQQATTATIQENRLTLTYPAGTLIFYYQPSMIGSYCRSPTPEPPVVAGTLRPRGFLFLCLFFNLDLISWFFFVSYPVVLSAAVRQLLEVDDRGFDAPLEHLEAVMFIGGVQSVVIQTVTHHDHRYLQKIVDVGTTDLPPPG